MPEENLLEQMIELADQIISRLEGINGKSDFLVPVSGAVLALQKDTLALTGIDIGEVSAFTTRRLIAEGNHLKSVEYNDTRRSIIDGLNQMAEMNIATAKRIQDEYLVDSPFNPEYLGKILFLHSVAIACKIWWMTMRGHQSPVEELQIRLIKIWRLLLSVDQGTAQRTAHGYSGHFFNGIQAKTVEDWAWTIPPCIENMARSMRNARS